MNRARSYLRHIGRAETRPTVKLPFQNLHSVPAQDTEISVKDSFPNKGTNFVPLNDRIVAERVSAVVIEFPAKVLAAVTDATVESAKNWRAGDNAPSLTNSIKLARKIPQVKWLIYQMIEEGEEQVGSTRFNTELVTTLLRIADGNDESAALAKAALQQMHGVKP